MSDHKAFTFLAANGVLAIPVNSYNQGLGYQNEIRLFKVDLATGFSQLGSVNLGGGFGSAIQRSIFIDNDIYAIGRQAIGVSSLDKTRLF